MTYNVLMRTLNPTHSLTHSLLLTLCFVIYIPNFSLKCESLSYLQQYTIRIYSVCYVYLHVLCISCICPHTYAHVYIHNGILQTFDYGPA